MNALFDENGMLTLYKLVEESPSFKAIMEDGIVTDEELAAQADTVMKLLHKVEAEFSPEQQQIVERLLAEINVLYVVYNYRELQSLK